VGTQPPQHTAGTLLGTGGRESAGCVLWPTIPSHECVAPSPLTAARCGLLRVGTNGRMRSERRIHRSMGMAAMGASASDLQMAAANAGGNAYSASSAIQRAIGRLWRGGGRRG